MAAVFPQTIMCKIQRLYPAGSSVEAATAPSRWDVSGNLDRDITETNRNTVIKSDGKEKDKELEK